SGFVGARFVRAALGSGVEIAALVHPDDPAPRIADVLPQVRPIRGSLEAQADWIGEVADFAPSVCLHLAWITEPGVYLESRENLKWLSMSSELVERCLEFGCTRVVAMGTCAEYDTSQGYLRVGTPTRPETMYAACKASMRLIGQQLCRAKGARFAWA